MSSASRAKPGILDVVRKMLNVFVSVLCTENLCTSVFGVYPSAFSPGEDLQRRSHPSSSSPADPCPRLPPAWPHPSGTSLRIQPDQSAPRQLPETFGPAGFKFWVLPLWASSSLPPALAFMPVLCLASCRELAAEDASPGCWAHGSDASPAAVKKKLG